MHDITKGMPTLDMSLKWLKVTISMHKRSHTFQEGFHSKKSTWNKTLTCLKAIFLVNPVNLLFGGYTMLNTFAPQKSVFIDFLDNAGSEALYLPS